ncbi:MAG: transposase [Acidobacteria bacterium]|nr:transposase [Acidobacteriota bacterium]
MLCCTLVISISKSVTGGYNDYIALDEGFIVCETANDYRPRNPEDNLLYGIVSENLETFLSRQHERGRTVPRFVERELRSFLERGVLVNGFLRVHCDTCGKDRVVPFSCKGRSVCSSCCGRRMADTAAHLVDRVFPKVPVRQWVLSLPFALRYRLAYDSGLLRDVLHIFIQAVFSWLRRRARDYSGIREAKCGAVTFVQRFGGAINLNIHLHSLIPDGVYYMDAQQRIRFQRLPKPSDSEVARVMERHARRIIRLLERRGLGPQADPDEADPLLRDQPLLAELYNASVQGRIATGPRAGNRVGAIGFQVEPENDESKSKTGCANVSGFSLHANVCIPMKARRQLENLCRYVARPAVATERLSILPDGRVSYRLRHKWRDGTTHVLFEPLELVEKLAALVPPPRFNLVRYSGIFAPASRWRSQIVPFYREESGSVHPRGCCGKKQKGNPNGKNIHKTAKCHPRNYSWAELMKRVWDVDVLKCDYCGGRMRILCAINAPDAIAKILDCLGLHSKSPPIYPAVQDSHIND